MKKVVSIVLMIVMAMTLVTVVNAATPTEDLKAFLSGEFTVLGEKVKLSNSDMVQVERYLENNPVTEAEAESIKSQVNDLVKYINDTDAKSIADLTTAQKNEVLNRANSVASVVGLSVNYDSKEKALSVLSGSNVIFSKSTDFKRTGGEVMPIVTLSALAIIAVAGVVYVKRNNK